MLNDGVRSVFGGSSVRWMFGGSLGVGVGRGEQRSPDVWYEFGIEFGTSSGSSIGEQRSA